MKKIISKKDLAKYIQERVNSLYTLEILKEEKEKIENDLKVLSEGKKKYNPWAVCTASVGREDKDKYEKCVMDVKKKQGMKESEKPSAGLTKKEKSAVVKKAKAGEDIGKKGKGFKAIEKKAKESGADDPKAVAAAAMWKNIKREGKRKKLNEGFSEKGITIVEKWIAEDGERIAAKKIIDNVLSRMIGMSSSDLPDTVTFANGLDEMEDLLRSKDYNGALEVAKETAKEMLEDEGFGDM